MVQEQMVKASIMKSGNALRGVDFDISTIGNNMIVVSGNDTVVIVEKL